MGRTRKVFGTLPSGNVVASRFAFESTVLGATGFAARAPFPGAILNERNVRQNKAGTDYYSPLLSRGFASPTNKMLLFCGESIMIQ